MSNKNMCLLGLATLVAAVCSPVGSAAEPLRLAVTGGIPPDVTAHHYWYSEEKGFFSKAGVTVKIIPVPDDQISLRGLAAGEFDVSETGCTAAMTAIEVGAPFRFIGAIEDKLDYSMIAVQDITKPSDLKGRSLGVSAPGAISYQVPKLLIEQDGGDFDSVKIVAVGGSSSRAKALINGTIDAGVVNSVWVARLAKYDNLHTIADATSLNLLFSCIITTEQMLKERRADLVAFLIGSLKGAKWGLDNPDQASSISQTLLPELDKKLVSSTVQSFADRKYWNVSGVIDKPRWDFTNVTMVKSGDLVDAVQYDKYVDTDVLKEASKDL